MLRHLDSRPDIQYDYTVKVLNASATATSVAPALPATIAYLLGEITTNLTATSNAIWVDMGANLTTLVGSSDYKKDIVGHYADVIAVRLQSRP